MLENASVHMNILNIICIYWLYCTDVLVSQFFQEKEANLAINERALLPLQVLMYIMAFTLSK